MKTRCLWLHMPNPGRWFDGSIQRRAWAGHDRFFCRAVENCAVLLLPHLVFCLFVRLRRFQATSRRSLQRGNSFFFSSSRKLVHDVFLSSPWDCDSHFWLGQIFIPHSSITVLSPYLLVFFRVDVAPPLIPFCLRQITLNLPAINGRSTTMPARRYRACCTAASPSTGTWKRRP